MTFRVYFNKQSAAPLVWSVDEGAADSEVNVRQVLAGKGCTLTSQATGEIANEHTPVAWLVVTALGYTIRDGVLQFIGYPD